MIHTCVWRSCVFASFLSVEDLTSNKKVPFERLDTEEHGWTRERCRLSVWKWLQVVTLPAQNVFGRTNQYDEQGYFIRTLPVKAQNDNTCQKFSGNGPIVSLATPMVTRKEWKRKNSTYLMFNLPDKNLATTQESQARQNSDENQYCHCQYWMISLVVLLPARLPANRDCLLKLYTSMLLKSARTVSCEFYLEKRVYIGLTSYG